MIKSKFDVAVVGAGVSGLLTAISIAKYTNSRVGLFEQGRNYSERKLLSLTDASVHLTGVGGAGTLEGGKLCSIPASGGLWHKTARELSQWESFVEHLPLNYFVRKTLIDSRNKYLRLNGRSDNLYEKKYETVLLLKGEMSAFITGLIEDANRNNVEIYKETTIANITKNGSGFGLKIHCGEDVDISANKLILATGRQSANKIQKMVANLPVRIIEQSPDLGIRIEFPKDHSLLFSEDGKDTKIKMETPDYKLRTFCVCAGGIISPITFDSVTYYDGQFSDKITDNTNLGIMSRSTSLRGVGAAVAYCKAFEGCDDGLSLDAFMKHGAGLLKSEDEAQFGQLIESINYFIGQLVNKGLISNNLKDCRVRYPSIDKYNPLIVTDHNFETECKNLFVIGDAAGVSRGYIQSLWSGWSCSHHIISQINNCKKYECISEMDEIVRYA